MDIFIFVIIFIIGTLIGSFCTLAVYRLPLEKDIVHERSFCPNCNHKLSFLDLIPILSYVFLRGKCRYCGEKIKIRYLLLELFSGFVAVCFAMQYNVTEISFINYAYIVLGLMYITSLIIIACIDKQYNYIQKGVLIFGIVVNLLYILYLYIVDYSNIYKYAIYTLIMLLLILIDTIFMKKYKKTSYVIQVLMLCIIIMTFSGTKCFTYSIFFTLITIALSIIFNKIKNKKNYSIPVAYIMCIFSIATLIFQNIL